MPFFAPFIVFICSPGSVPAETSLCFPTVFVMFVPSLSWQILRVSVHYVVYQSTVASQQQRSFRTDCGEERVGGIGKVDRVPHKLNRFEIRLHNKTKQKRASASANVERFMLPLCVLLPVLSRSWQTIVSHQTQTYTH
jgi:hypothetical protein